MLENLIIWLKDNPGIGTTVVLVLLRVLEAIQAVLKDKPKGVIELVMKVIREIFRFG